MPAGPATSVGICGVVVWVLGTSVQGDLLLCGVGGIALGAMLAELHVVRPQHGPRTATLDVRALGAYLTDRDRNRMIGVAGAAAVLIAMAAIEDGFGVGVVCGGAALVVLGAANLVQRRVASRPRPAIAASLRRADDLARELAIGRGLAQPATYFGLALVGRGRVLAAPRARRRHDAGRCRRLDLRARAVVEQPTARARLPARQRRPAFA